jgi:hypothetical protein
VKGAFRFRWLNAFSGSPLAAVQCLFMESL